MLQKIRNIVWAIWYRIWGEVLAILYFDRKFLRGRWFNNKHAGLGSEGWRWVTTAALEKIIHDKNRTSKYPIGKYTQVICPENIEFDEDDLNIFQSRGCYYQAHGKITIGKGTWIAPNVGIITANHDIYDLEHHTPPRDVVIGKKCWIGMNSVVLPGVCLGDQTIVGAGSVVTKSFNSGHCIIAGNPAKTIRFLETSEEINE